MSTNMGPLAGIRVLDLGRHLSCPSCGMTLGDLGAEVIKVEKQGYGDETRHEGQKVNGQSIYYLTENRNKKGITIDFRSEEGKEVLRELIKKSDVLIENFRFGTMKKMGFDWETVHALNPRLIMASISGYGEGSPYKERPGFDTIMSATTGIMHLNRAGDVPRITGGIWYADILAGMWATVGILAALNKRNITGEGQYVDIAMYDACINALNTYVPTFDQLGVEPDDPSKYVYACPSGTFKSKDGWVVCLAGIDSLFERLLTITDDPFLNKPEFKKLENRIDPDNYVLINEATGRLMQTKTGDEWDEIFAEIGIPGGKIKDLGDVLNCPATYARNTTVKLDIPDIGPVIFAGTPLNFSGETLGFTRPPELGEHNREVYGELLGLSDEELAKLEEKKVI